MINPVMIAFMQTLLPEPVEPATRVWGMRARSAITGSPVLPPYLVMAGMAVGGLVVAFLFPGGSAESHAYTGER